MAIDEDIVLALNYIWCKMPKTTVIILFKPNLRSTYLSIKVQIQKILSTKVQIQD